MGSDDDLGTGLLELAKKALVLDLVEVGLGGEYADDTRCEITDQGRTTCSRRPVFGLSAKRGELRDRSVGCFPASRRCNER